MMASTDYCNQHRDCYECGHGRKAFKLLAAYENTGLTPAEISAMQTENATLKKALELAYMEANNAIYFSDSSDYGTALYDVCKAIKPDVDPDEIGTEFME